MWGKDCFLPLLTIWLFYALNVVEDIVRDSLLQNNDVDSFAQKYLRWKVNNVINDLPPIFYVGNTLNINLLWCIAIKQGTVRNMDVFVFYPLLWFVLFFPRGGGRKGNGKWEDKGKQECKPIYASPLLSDRYAYIQHQQCCQPPVGFYRRPSAPVTFCCAFAIFHFTIRKCINHSFSWTF